MPSPLASEFTTSAIATGETTSENEDENATTDTITDAATTTDATAAENPAVAAENPATVAENTAAAETIASAENAAAAATENAAVTENAAADENAAAAESAAVTPTPLDPGHANDTIGTIAALPVPDHAPSALMAAEFPPKSPATAPPTSTKFRRNFLYFSLMLAGLSFFGRRGRVFVNFVSPSQKISIAGLRNPLIFPVLAWKPP